MAVGNHPGEADRDPREAEQGRRDRERTPPALARALGWVLAVVAIAAGIGWLYVLEKAHVLGLGPRMSGALPLEELASRGAQPLTRMAAAWIPAGIAATVEEPTLRVDWPPSDAARITEVLATDGLWVSELRTKQRNLEDQFLALTEEAFA